MSAYLDNSINAANYQKNRITYPKSLYETVLQHHLGERNLAVDVGCGTGIGSFPLLDYFEKVVGCDPSEKMLQTARMIADTIPESSKRNVEFKETGGETLGKYFKEDSVDLIVAGESLQYTKFEQFFEQAHKILKPNGTLAYWFYCDPIFIDYPKANEIFKYFVYEDERFFKAFWPPEMDYVRHLGSTIEIPKNSFTDVYSEKYIPLKSEKAGKFLISRDDFTLKDLRDKMSTWSVYQRWLDTEKDSKEDIIDVIIEKIKNECNLTESTSLKVQWETAFYITHNKA